MLDLALKMLERSGWKEFSFTDLAVELKKPLYEVQQQFPSKVAVLIQLHHKIEKETLGVRKACFEETETTSKDLLLELFMERFEALSPYKSLFGKILSDIRTEPLTLKALAPHLHQTMKRILEAAHIKSEGVLGSAKVVALETVYLAAFDQWLEDDSEGFEKTLAVLDEHLSMLEALAEKAKKLK